jgi:hypothetical protein
MNSHYIGRLVHFDDSSGQSKRAGGSPLAIMFDVRQVGKEEGDRGERKLSGEYVEFCLIAPPRESIIFSGHDNAFEIGKYLRVW